MNHWAQYRFRATISFSRFLSAFAVVAVLSACEPKPDTLFTRLSPESSGLEFENTIVETPEINILTYEYTYNGGGVAAGDFNNDGLCDLYFTGNAVANKLFLNKGALEFQDVTAASKTGGRPMWKTGVTAADVNGDGLLDLYVCYSGPDAKQSLSNELFINNGIGEDGVPTFTERAAEFGLAAEGTFSTQASFFDYDRDGDLDMFLINHGNHFYSPFINTNKLRNMRHPQFGNRLYRNEMISSDTVAGQYFTEVSSKAGIHGGGINFGLGVSISDVNNDGWPDIFVTNDYEEQDFLYVNNGDGTFSDVTKSSFGHFSRNGMGTDIADLNNDGLTDLVEVDMWPEDNYRQKLLRGPDDHNRFNLMVDSGFHHQQMRNTLQLNAGSSAGTPIFCEIGQLAGISSTDWSWAPLIADFDNDGNKDLFVTNGYLRDFTSMDFLKYTVESERAKARQEGKELQVYDLVSKMASTKTSDYIFRNNGDLTFTDQTASWGMKTPNLSFGAAYADLDNDGDLELITNNTNEPATLWVNNSEKKVSNNYLSVRLVGSASNRAGIGAKVSVNTDSATLFSEQYPARGFQSSVDPVIHFGLGKNTKANAITVTWPDGKRSSQTDVSSNQTIEVSYATAKADSVATGLDNPSFRDVTLKSGIDFVHRENAFNDFDREPLLPYQPSRLGPSLASADVNADGLEDFFIGGAVGQGGKLFLAKASGQFVPAPKQPWGRESAREDVGAVFFDADSDKDLDLFVVSGGNEYPVGSENLDDRLYVNDGKGNFQIAPTGSIIADHASGSCVAAGDYDRDGDMDLYVGGRLLPGSYPVTTPGAILKNESSGGVIRFTVATREVNAELREPGMVTDAIWSDFNNDSWPDLIIVGEWMTVRLYQNQNGRLVEFNAAALDNSAGLWSRILPVDVDKDGDTDYVLGNAGQNLPWKISTSLPLTLFYDDFNSDNRIDPIICYTTEGGKYPVASRDEIFTQINSLRKKFTSYDAYGRATIETMFDAAALQKAKKLEVSTTRSAILENLGNGFVLRNMPIEAQMSAVNGIVTRDFNADGNPDVLLAGNFYPYRTQYGRSDASMGLLLLGDGHGNWKPKSWRETGFVAPGDIRNMTVIRAKGGKEFILLARNNDRLSIFEFDKFE